MEIREIRDSDIASYAKCIGSVAKEKKYLLLTSAPPIEVIDAFIKETILQNYIFLVATDEKRVIGWCDIRPYTNPARSHIGILGMGVIKEYRGKGIGKSLLTSALENAKSEGFEGVHLEVFASNQVAIKLYEKFGFQIDGRKKRARKFKNKYEDIVLMSYLF